MPSLRRFLVTTLGLVWLLAKPGLLPAQSHVRPLPPSVPLGSPAAVAMVDPPYDYVPEDWVAGQPLDVGVYAKSPSLIGDAWTWQILPDGLLYPAYLAGGRESRFGSQWFHERDADWLWDIALGSHVGILRYGNCDPCWPEGFQADIEGAAFPRLTLGDNRDLVSVDFRFGIPLTYRRGPVETKFGYYHLSSHMGDERMVRLASLDRINYSRDVLVAGLAVRPHVDLRLYAEAGWAFNTDGGSEPWEFQFGIDYSPIEPWWALATPFFAVNTRIREELDFGGNLTVQTGLQWRGRTGQLFRTGLHYFNGKTDQYQFFREHEEQIGIGMWYDF